MFCTKSTQANSVERFFIVAKLAKSVKRFFDTIKFYYLFYDFRQVAVKKDKSTFDVVPLLHNLTNL